MKIIRADKFHRDVRAEISIIFADGFTQWLEYFSKDKHVIAKAFEHVFILDKFYVAIIDDQVAGMVACTDCHTLSMHLDQKEFRKHFGIIKGSIAGHVLKKEFEAPFKNPPDHTGSIEFVGVSADFRKQGVASKIISHIIDHTPYKTYLIKEVADTNLPAMNLYQKLGFKEHDRKTLPEKNAKKIGINHFISLKYEKKESIN